jgi:hypothetical protein
VFFEKNALIERKSRMPQIRNIKGEAVVIYCEPLITREAGLHRLSPEGKQKGIFVKYISFIEALLEYIRIY